MIDYNNHKTTNQKRKQAMITVAQKKRKVNRLCNLCLMHWVIINHKYAQNTGHYHYWCTAPLTLSYVPFDIHCFFD